MLHNQNKRRLFCIELMTLISGASLVDYTSAQYSNSYYSGADRASSRHDALTQSQAGGASPAVGHPNSQSSHEVNRPQERTSLDVVSPQAQAHIDYALNLAERGAVESAQAEFTLALDLVADALDADNGDGTRAHARAVKAGLKAIDESKDFVPADTPHDVEIILSQLAATHQTPVLRNVDTTRMTRAEVLQLYHSYATQQLAFAGGRSAIASSALYGLGRAECINLAGAGTRNPLGAPNAMALYQAAIVVDPQNYRASNELGVLMARYGDLDGASGQLVHSLSVKPQVETWHNLAVVYRRMGQPEKAAEAERAQEELLAAARGGGVVAQVGTDLGSHPTLQWVDADAFAATATPYGLDGPAINSDKSAAIAQRDSLGKRLISKLNPWSKSDKPQQNSNIAQSSLKTEPSRSGEAGGSTLFK